MLLYICFYHFVYPHVNYTHRKSSFLSSSVGQPFSTGVTLIDKQFPSLINQLMTTHIHIAFSCVYIYHITNLVSIEYNHYKYLYITLV